MRKYALLGGRLLDGKGGDPIENSLILIDGARLAYAGPDKGSRADYADYEVIDIAGRTVIPGLIDTHIHFGGLLSEEVRDWVLEPPLQKAIISVKEAQNTLKRGVTTVGDMSENGIHLRNMIESGHMLGPRIIAAGRGLCRSSGHSIATDVPDSFNRDNHPWAEQVDGPWEIRKAIRNRIRQKPQAFKIWVTGGGLNPLDRREDLNYTYEEIEAAVQEAALVGIPVWAHAEGYLGTKYACEIGVHTLIHGEALDDALLQMMAEKKIFFCPTIQLFHAMFKRPDYSSGTTRELDENGLSAIDREFIRINANLRKAVDLGIKVTVGSDSFCDSIVPYGTTAIEEMYALHAGGMTEMEVLVAATKNGAEMLGVAELTGTIEAGKMADLVVLTENPLENIRNVAPENMAMVIKDGALVRL